MLASRFILVVAPLIGLIASPNFIFAQDEKSATEKAAAAAAQKWLANKNML